MPDAARDLDRFLARYSDDIAAQARDALARLTRRYPAATRLVYDNYNALVIAFSTSAQPSGIVCSIALYPRWVTLFFADGADLPDPDGLLEGDGKTIRGHRLDDGAAVDRPAVRRLLDEAFARAATPLDGKRDGALVIQSISPKQRPRRPK